MGRRGNAAAVGAFVVGGIALALGAVIAFGAGLFGGHHYPFVSYFTGSVNGLSVGAPVKYRGVQIGRVTNILLQWLENENDPRIPVFYSLDGERISQLGGGEVGGGDLGDRDRLKASIARGLRAQLQAESIVTGVLYVELDVKPATPVNLALGDDSPVPEIPTLPTALEQAQELFDDAMTTIREIDVKAIARSLRDATDGLARLVNSPELPKTLSGAQEVLAEIRRLVTRIDAQIDPLARGFTGTREQFDRALDALRASLDRLNAVVDPEAPLPVELRRALVDFGDAARSVRELASYLERHPDALLFGKDGNEP